MRVPFGRRLVLASKRKTEPMFANLDLPPAQHDAMFWADFAELRAVVHLDKCFSAGDLDSVAQRAKDMERGFNSADRWRLIADTVQIRQHTFGPIYPFTVSSDRDTVSLEFDESDGQTAYLGFLIASCLRHIVPQVRNTVARDFENAALVVFSKLMPNGSKIRPTWAAGGSEAPYTGNLHEKLTALANDIRCTPNFVAADFSATDVGDGGIDIVSWHPMADNRAGIPISFVQCGCSKDDWEFKQVEAHTSKHRPRLPVMHPWANYYFMPLDFRRPDGDWARKSDLGEVIIVDRLRLLKLAQEFNALSELPEMEYVAEALVSGYL